MSDRVRPFVSVIVATRNRAALLAETLDAVVAQRWPRDGFEIVVADNGSVDATRATVEAVANRGDAPAVRYLHVTAPGKSAAINHAITEARGELLAFTDDDVVPEPLWLERLAAAFEQTRADFVAGRILPNWETEPPRWLSPALYGVLAVPDNGTERQHIRPGMSQGVMPIGANMAVRAAVVARIGGWRTDLGKLDGTLRTGEDHEFFLRLLAAGCTGAYEPTARVRHFVPAERLERSYFRRWMYQNGRDVARVEADYPPRTRRLLGVPRYLWRQAASDAATVVSSILRGDTPRRTAAMLRLIWFVAYVRESWFGAPARSSVLRLAEGR
jgi:glycosyltransferase involved in cell wall biosynthesis